MISEAWLPIVAKLFNIVKLTRAYFDRRIFSRLLLLEKMAKDLDMPVDIIVSPIIREHDGLATEFKGILSE